jgi:hypothetical protein
VDLPDEFPGVVPEFRSRRKAEALPKLRPAESAKGFDASLSDSGWYRGFLCGVFAAIGGLVCLAVVARMALLAYSWGWLG